MGRGFLYESFRKKTTTSHSLCMHFNSISALSKVALTVSCNLNHQLYLLKFRTHLCLITTFSRSYNREVCIAVLDLRRTWSIKLFESA